MKALIAWTIVLASACTPSKSSGPQAGVQGRRGGMGGGKLQYPVVVAPLVTRQMTYTVNEPGSLDAFQQVQITARVAGAVDRVAFTEGQDVKAGTVLATIESERYAIALEQAKTDVAKCDAALKSAKAALDRRLEAQKESPGIVAGEEIEQKQTAVDSAVSDLAAAKEAQRVAELNLRDSSVRAPIAGTVQTRTVVQGQFLQPGAVLATIMQLDPMLLRFEVTTADAPRIQKGMTAHFQLKETDHLFDATVTLVSGEADPSTRMVPVTATVDDRTHKWFLRPGAFCKVSVPIGNARAGIVVPSIAVQSTASGSQIWVIDDKSTAHAVTVQLGMHTEDGGVEIKGATEGQKIVTSGIDPLSEGAPVQVTATTTLDQALKDAAATAAGSDSGSAAPSAGSDTSPGSGSGEHHRGSAQ
ncbi:MAG TPA: efflux RND transporter periplasmic adaptor subunit [Kofleriaceae bacterium]|nr:efflux RND transporter periplasmic adaptor subunit [Kofleriaceae bacterium]